jgi:hypothetical protein
MSMTFCTSVRISHGEKEGWSGGTIEGKLYLSISSITSRTEAFPTRLNNGGMPTLRLLLRGTITTTSSRLNYTFSLFSASFEAGPLTTLILAAELFNPL